MPENDHGSGLEISQCSGTESMSGLARDPPHGRYQIDGVQPDIANRTPYIDERLSVDGPKGISGDSAAIYEHCEQAPSERL